MLVRIVFIYFIMLLCQAQAEINEGFPKILWVYWQQGYEKAQPFTQLSINNKQEYAARSGWEMRFLTEQTLHQYIDVSVIDQMMEHAQDKLVQLRADILRMMLIYQYGGMWMDANSLFLRKLDWVDQIQNDAHIYNKLSHPPQILISAYTKYSHGGNITYLYDEKYKQIVNIFPGLENWFILAKPKSIFLRDALDSLKTILKTKKKEMDEKILSEGIILSKQHLDPYLIGSDYLFQILLQRKQKELDAKKQGVKYAVEHYKIWHFEADESVYKFTVYTRFKRYQMWADLISYSMQDLRDVFQQSPHFLKFVGWQHPEFSLFLADYAQFNCWGGDFLIQNDSIIYKYLLQGQNSTIATSIKSLESHKGDKNFCRMNFKKEFLQNNHEKVINFIVQLGFILSLMMIMAFVKFIYNFCQNTLVFEKLPQSYP